MRKKGGSESIFMSKHSAELKHYTDNILRKISKTHQIPYETLLESIVVDSGNNADDASDLVTDEMELIHLDNKNYWYIPRTQHVYSYTKKPQLIGKLDEFASIMPVPLI